MDDDAFPGLCVRAGLPLPEREFLFARPRRWRFDYAWPSLRLALEIEGGSWKQGRHTRGKGFLGDMEKYNAAAVLGWRLLRATPRQHQAGETVLLVQRAMEAAAC